MRITNISIYPLEVPLSEPFVISLGTITHARNLLVVISTDTGLSGQGECSPYPFINGELQEGQMASAGVLGRLWLGKDAREIENRLAELDGFLKGNLALKSAFDMALYDLNARYAGLPLYRFLGGANDRELWSDRTVSVGNPEAMAKEALKYLEMGFKAIKVKLGGPFEQDLARIKAIRSLIGLEIPLRIDANQAWTVSEGLRTLRALEPLNVEHCEEPIRAGDLAGMRFLRKNSPIPIMADESLFDHFDAMHLVQMEACDYFNIKLSKSGGISKALKIAAIGEAAGIPCQVGCFSESRLAITALVHFVLARKIVVHYDLDSPLMLSEDPVNGGVELLENGRSAVVDEQPGLGATIKEEFLDKGKCIELAIDG